MTLENRPSTTDIVSAIDGFSDDFHETIEASNEAIEIEIETTETECIDASTLLERAIDV